MVSWFLGLSLRETKKPIGFVVLMVLPTASLGHRNDDWFRGFMVLPTPFLGHRNDNRFHGFVVSPIPFLGH